MENTAAVKAKRSSSAAVKFLCILLILLSCSIVFFGFNYSNSKEAIEQLSPIASSATVDPVRAYVKVDNSIVEVKELKPGENYILVGIPLGETKTSNGAEVKANGDVYQLTINKDFNFSSVEIKFLGGTVYLPVKQK